jgi:hypothetical protein
MVLGRAPEAAVRRRPRWLHTGIGTSVAAAVLCLVTLAAGAALKGDCFGREAQPVG